MSILYRTIDGDLVDQICASHYGFTGGSVEAVLNANPGLAGRGERLPAGVVIMLPDLAPQEVFETPLIRLWD